LLLGAGYRIRRGLALPFAAYTLPPNTDARSGLRE